MQKLKQTIVKRKSHTTDEGTMGFHDYVEKKEGFSEFVGRVTDALSLIHI